jgi:hypothetical protein
MKLFCIENWFGIACVSVATFIGLLELAKQLFKFTYFLIRLCQCYPNMKKRYATPPGASSDLQNVGSWCVVTAGTDGAGLEIC